MLGPLMHLVTVWLSLVEIESVWSHWALSACPMGKEEKEMQLFSNSFGVEYGLFAQTTPKTHV